jgi:hypothetical protein
MAYFVPGVGVVGNQQRQDTSGKSSTKQGELYPADNKADGLIFQYNPEKISRQRQPQYSEVGAAAADYWTKYNGPSPLQWVRNPPEVISFELLFSESGDKDVEAAIEKVRKMMSPSGSNPRGQVPGPPDLIFSYGNRSDRVRITSASFDEERHTPSLKVQQVRIKLDLKTVKAGSK